MAAAVAVIVIAFEMRGDAPFGSPLAGTAASAPGGMFWLGFGALFALVALAAWAASRRG